MGTATGSATRIQVYVEGHPNDLRSNTFVYASGWNESLPIGTEDCITTSSACTTQKRWTWNEWTQDNTGVSYILNPRITQSLVGDSGSTRKTVINYGTNGFGLPEIVTVQDGDTVLKTQTTSYNLSSNYTDKRIIGLPSESRLYEGTWEHGTLMSKVTFAYDENGYTDSSQNVSSPTKHASGYGMSFNYRGNLTSTKRWDVTNSTTINDNNLTSKSSVVYNILGSPIKQKDALNREVTISYTDDWNDSVSRTTYAYPTTITDPNGNYSTVEYRFDTGANVWARSPTPSGTGNVNGKTTTREYNDILGRVTKETIVNSGAYTEYEYANSGNALTTFSTIIDVDNSNSANAADEVATESVFDGAGRLLKTRTANPNSSGGYTGKKIEYDILGRAFRETVPTEMNSGWNPAGDDYRSNTWLWNTKEFDWKGRVTRSIPSDSTGSDGKDTLIEYTGCGCAGGQVTTIKGPVTTAVDVSGNTQTTKRRWQKVYEDILGRTYKTETWDLDGAGSSPYSTTKTTFNGRDQATLVRQYAGADTSSTYQDTTMSYDGHGRLHQMRKPEFDSGKYVTTTYNADDSVATVTDPREAVTTYSYGLPSLSEKRAVVTGITYSVPSGSGINVPANVSFTYDAVGNRTYMSDGTGELTYAYDELSRLKTETKDFTDSLSQTPGGSGVYTLTYNYHLAGSLKSITEPFGSVVNYAADAVGRTTAVGNSGSSTAYASNIAHRAFGGVKSMTISPSGANPVAVTKSYDNALRPSSYVSDSNANNTDIHNATYSYRSDGTLDTLDNAMDPKFDQAKLYDFAGRLKENKVGNSTDGYSYQQTLGYDAFGNLTNRWTKTWELDDNSFSATYTNNRKTTGGSTPTFDAAGNTTYTTLSSTEHQAWSFDASGRQWRWEERLTNWEQTKYAGETTFDGDGRAAKVTSLQSQRTGSTWSSWAGGSNYTIFSSVTGQKVSALEPNGALQKNYIYLGDTQLLENGPGLVDSYRLTDPVVGSTRDVQASGAFFAGDESTTRNESGGLGMSIPHVQPTTMPFPDYATGKTYLGNPETGFTLNGAPVTLAFLQNFLRGRGIKVHGDTILQTMESEVSYIDDDGKRVAESEIVGYNSITVPSGVFDSDQACINAMLSMVPSSMLEYAKIAVPLLDKVTSGWTYGAFSYLLATTEIESRFGAPAEGLDFSVSVYEDWNPDRPTRQQQGYEPQIDGNGRVTNSKARQLGNFMPGDGYRFRGRGYIQPTGRGGYYRIGRLLGLPDIVASGNQGTNSALGSGINAFTENPDMLADPQTAALVAAAGLENDVFVQGGRKLNKLLNSNNPTRQQLISARSFVNGTDRAGEIADKALGYLGAMRGICFR